MRSNDNEFSLISSAEQARRAALAKLANDKALFMTEAEKALEAGPFSVTEKTTPPPGGTLHDYWSLGPYWWPHPDKPDGMPYIRRDGHVNPDSRGEGFDRSRIDGLASAIDALRNAWFATDDKKYSDRIIHLLRVFFLDDGTRMNPSLTYGQSIPGICDGRGIGIIETVKFIDLIDAVVHLRQAGACPDEDWVKMRNWFGDYLNWLRSSKHGDDERAAKNNHGTWMDAQLMVFAIFTDKMEFAREVALEVPAKRIDKQIMPDGRQPLELERTRSFTYSVYNLLGLVTMAQLACRVGVDLWNHHGPDNQSILSAFEFLEPFGSGERPWPYLQIDETTGEKWATLDRNALTSFAALFRRIKGPVACPSGKRDACP